MENKETKQERISKLIRNLNVSIAEFERSVGWKGSRAYNIPESSDRAYFECITTAYPFVNIDWIVSGEGDMFLNSDYRDFTAYKTYGDRSEVFEELISSLKSKLLINSQKDLAIKTGTNVSYLSQMINGRRKINNNFFERLQKLDPELDIELFRKKLDEVDALYNSDSDNDNESEIDFADIVADNSDESDNKIRCLNNKRNIVPIIPPQVTKNVVNYINSNKENIIYVEPGQMFPSYDLIWRVPSSAMSPCVEKGDILYLKKVDYDESILNGSVYLIDSSTHGLMLRIVHHNNDTLRCISLSKVIEPVVLSRSEIKDIFSISGMFKFDVPLHKFNIMSEEYKDKEEGLKIVLNQNTNLISEMQEQGKRIDILLDIIQNDRKQN